MPIGSIGTRHDVVARHAKIGRDGANKHHPSRSGHRLRPAGWRRRVGRRDELGGGLGPRPSMGSHGDTRHISGGSSRGAPADRSANPRPLRRPPNPIRGAQRPRFLPGPMAEWGMRAEHWPGSIESVPNPQRSTANRRAQAKTAPRNLHPHCRLSASRIGNRRPFRTETPPRLGLLTAAADQKPGAEIGFSHRSGITKWPQ